MEGPSGKLYAGRSLWGMLPAQEPRRSAVRLAELLVERPGLSEDAPWPRRLPAAAAPAPPHPREQPRRPGSVWPWPWPWLAFFAWAWANSRLGWSLEGTLCALDTSGRAAVVRRDHPAHDRGQLRHDGVGVSPRRDAASRGHLEVGLRLPAC